MIKIVKVHPEASMSIPTPHENGSIEWHMRYGDTNKNRFLAANLIADYDYLLCDDITTKEAVRRLRILRKAHAIARGEV